MAVQRLSLKPGMSGGRQDDSGGARVDEGGEVKVCSGDASDAEVYVHNLGEGYRIGLVVEGDFGGNVVAGIVPRECCRRETCGGPG